MKPQITGMTWLECLALTTIVAVAMGLAWWLMGQPVELIRAHVPDQPTARE